MFVRRREGIGLFILYISISLLLCGVDVVDRKIMKAMELKARNGYTYHIILLYHPTYAASSANFARLCPTCSQDKAVRLQGWPNASGREGHPQSP